MVVSTAVGEFAEILAGLERTDKEVRSVSLAETDGEAETVTASVEVGVPVIDDTDLADDVTIGSPDAAVTDGRVAVTLEFSIPVRESESPPGRPNGLYGTAGTSSAESANGTPAYKDPEALREVYENYDSFPAMTSALGVDVTSETVRRYMVKYGIHDPDEPDDESEDRSDGESKSRSDDGIAESETEATEPSTAESDEHSTRDRSSSADGDRTDLENRPVAELLANTDLDENDSIVADGIGVPQELTVSDLTEILDRSRTVSEATRALDLEHDQTRRILRDLGVIEFVTGRLTSQDTDVTIGEVERRLRDNVLTDD